ncbi:hypothetical protein EIP91_006880 [Steccherinum ochraceum]|uniref:F-box domain-containing protein n=1 Tax=Steccherinum ochraceum TaxID=92696 RepID=A0A4R0R7Q7_9APHY|nr:hypothetical protein EIP91_006880 [Steccherinum ochraceum]
MALYVDDVAPWDHSHAFNLSHEKPSMSVTAVSPENVSMLSYRPEEEKKKKKHSNLKRSRRRRPVNTLPRIPLDIWHLVMEAIPRSRSDYDQTLDLRALVACALTCRSWRGVAQKVLNKLRPRTDGRVVLRSGADLALLPRTAAYRRSIRRLTISPISLTDQGWVTAVLLNLVPKLSDLEELRLDNLCLTARHPDFYKVWPLVYHPGTRLVLGRIFNIPRSRLIRLLRGCDVDIRPPYLHLSQLAPWNRQDIADDLSTLRSADDHNLSGFSFKRRQAKFVGPSISDPLLVKITLGFNKTWGRVIPFVDWLDFVCSHRHWDLTVSYQHTNDSALLDHHFISSLIQRLPHLQTLRLDGIPFAPLAPNPGHRGAPGVVVHLQELDLHNTSLDIHQAAWLWSVLKFRKLTIGGTGANIESRRVFDPPGPILEGMDTLILRQTDLRRNLSIRSLIRLSRPSNITSFTLERDGVPLPDEESTLALEGLLRCISSSLEHITLSLKLSKIVPNTYRSCGLQPQPAVNTFSRYPRLQTLEIEFHVERLSNLLQEEFQWIRVSLANCRSRMRRVDLKFDFRSYVRKAHRLPLFLLDWQSLEPALLGENIEHATLHVKLSSTVLGPSDLKKARVELQAHLESSLPTLHGRGCLRLSVQGGDEQARPQSIIGLLSERLLPSSSALSPIPTWSSLVQNISPSPSRRHLAPLHAPSPSHPVELPLELWYIVLEAILVSPEDYDQTSKDILTLVACCLTCRTWFKRASALLETYKPRPVVVLTTRADLTALPLSHCSVIRDFTIRPRSLTDQGWVTAALCTLGPRLLRLDVLRMDGICLQTQHPDFWKSWSLVSGMDVGTICIGRVYYTRISSVARLLRFLRGYVAELRGGEEHEVDASYLPRTAQAYTNPLTVQRRPILTIDFSPFRMVIPTRNLRRSTMWPLHNVLIPVSWDPNDFLEPFPTSLVPLGGIPVTTLYAHMRHVVRHLELRGRFQVLKGLDIESVVAITQHLHALHTLHLAETRIVGPTAWTTSRSTDSGEAMQIAEMVLEDVHLDVGHLHQLIVLYRVTDTLCIIGCELEGQNRELPDNSPRIHLAGVEKLVLRRQATRDPWIDFFAQYDMRSLRSLELRLVQQDEDDEKRLEWFVRRQCANVGYLNLQLYDLETKTSYCQPVPGGNIAAQCPALRHMTVSLTVGLCHKLVAFHWTHAVLAECPVTIRRITIAVDLFRVVNPEQFGWSYLEKVLLRFRNLDGLIFQISGITAESSSHDAWRSMLVLSMPELHSRGLLSLVLLS